MTETMPVAVAKDKKLYATPTASRFARGVPEEVLAELDSDAQRALRKITALPEGPRLEGEAPRAQAAVAAILFYSDQLLLGPGSLSVPGAQAHYPLEGARRTSKRNKPVWSEIPLPQKELQWIFTTRAMTLRSHPGQASLPGGKVDPTDKTLAEAALREADEEIGLDRTLVGDKVFYLHTAKPFLSKTCLLVHPVVLYLSDASVVPTLLAEPDEVECIWTFPARYLLSSLAPPVPLQDPAVVDTHRRPQEAFRTYSDVPWVSSDPYRLHRFRSTQQLIKGLTADICLHLAGDLWSGPKYRVLAQGQPERGVWVRRVLGGSRTDRWGDGEGDLLPSAHAFATVEGTDDAGGGV